MPIENIAYLITFVITSGVTVIGILSAYSMAQAQKKPVTQLLLYQQIFLFSFFIYGIWGNAAIRETISELNLPLAVTGKLLLFVPVIGTPFLIISWYMLIKFVYSLGGRNVPRKLVVLYFILFFTVIFSFAFLVQNKIITVPVEPLAFIVRTLVLLNLAVHFTVWYPVLKPRKNTPISLYKNKLTVFFAYYFAGVLCYSVLIWNFRIFGYLSTCISILFLFVVSIIIPVYFQQKQKKLFEVEVDKNLDFEAFCTLYEISNREAEIILEICSGKSNKAIAEKLFITLQTVKDHNHRIYTKTQVKSRIQLTNLVREKTGSVPNPGKV